MISAGSVTNLDPSHAVLNCSGTGNSLWKNSRVTKLFIPRLPLAKRWKAGQCYMIGKTELKPVSWRGLLYHMEIQCSYVSSVTVNLNIKARTY